MSIVKSKNGYRIKARIRINGRIISKQETFKGSKEAAKVRFEQMKSEIREKAFGSLKDWENHRYVLETFRDLLFLYEQKKGPFSVSHQLKIDALKRELGDIHLDVFPERFERYYTVLKTQPVSRHGKILSNCSINRKTEIVKAAFKLLVDLEMIDKNPISNTRVRKLKTVPRDVIITPEQQAALMKSIKKNAPHIEPVVRYALQVPCRRSELVNMRRDDLDLFNNCIRVRNGMTKNDAGIWKPIPPDMIEYFRNIPKESEFLFYRVVNGSRTDRSGENRQYLPLGDFKRAWMTALDKAGLAHIGLRLHDTRHVAATNLVNNGTPEEAVMQVAGWKTNMLRVYYNRNPIRALSLVRFNSDVSCEHFVNTKKTKNAEI